MMPSQSPMANRVDLVMLGPNYNTSNDIIINVTTNNSNNSTPIDDYDHKWSFEFSVIIATILSISAFLTIVGNSMVLLVIIRHRGMRTRTNLFLVNLAVADLLVGLFVVPFSITTLIENRWVFGDGFICMFNGWMNAFCIITSFHTLMYISIHKYYSIARPLDNPLTLNYILAMMAAAWIWAFIGATLAIAGLTVEYKPGTSQCGPRYPHDALTFIYHGILQSTVIIVPAGILIYCYSRMYIEIRKHSQRLRTNSTVEEDVILSQQKKVAVTLFIVLATFVMMAMPYHLYATYTTIERDKQHFSSYINPLAYMFLYLSSMCNPIIYAFRSPAFREGYKEILCQTANYVTNDDSDVYPRGRISSIISTIRRASNFSGGQRTSLQEPDSRLDLPTKKQKSLFNLLRSTRQSNAASVVHRNGNIIIMKGGKIVSYRPEGREGSPFLDPAQTLKQTSAMDTGLAAGLAGPGHVMFGLLCEGESDQVGEGDGSQSVSRKGSDFSCEGSEIALEQAGKKDHEISTSDVRENGGFHYSITDNVKFQPTESSEKHLMNNTKSGSLSSVDTEQTTQVDVHGRRVPVLCADRSASRAYDGNPIDSTTLEILGESRCEAKTVLPQLQTSKLPYGENVFQAERSGAVSAVNKSDDDILSVMPLSPHTREILAKSDMHLSHTESDLRPHKGGMAKSLTFSCSTDNLGKPPRPPRLRRLPSVEFLDPPIHVFRSNSSASVSSKTQRQRASSKSPKQRRGCSQSPELGSHSSSNRRYPQESSSQA